MIAFAFLMWPVMLLIGLVAGAGMEREAWIDEGEALADGEHEERMRRIGKAEW